MSILQRRVFVERVWAMVKLFSLVCDVGTVVVRFAGATTIAPELAKNSERGALGRAREF